MPLPARKLIEDFDGLSAEEKTEVASAILRRYLQVEFPPLTDTALVEIADALFLDLDRRET